MILTYEAVDSDGRRTSDSIEARDRRDAVDQLRDRGLYVTTISERLRRKGSSALAAATGRGDRLPLNVLVELTRQVAMLLRAGSGIVPSYLAIQRQLKNPKHVAIISDLVTDLEDGATLTDALRKHPRSFGPTYCAVVAAGEASGKLSEMFERLATIVGKSRAMQRKLLGALAYPALLIVMCGHIFLVLLFFVVPRFGALFAQLGAETPAVTQLMLDMAVLLRGHWPALLAGLVAVVGVLVWTLRQESGKQWLSNVQIRIPVVGRLSSRLIQAQVFRTSGMLLESGVGVLETIDLVRPSTRNDRFQKLFTRMEEAVTSGGRLSYAFEESGIVDPAFCQAIRTGEDSGYLGGSITYCADVLEETNEELVNTVSKLIEPLILIFMGFVVGGVAIALFVPLFDLTSAMR